MTMDEDLTTEAEDTQFAKALRRAAEGDVDPAADVAEFNSAF